MSGAGGVSTLSLSLNQLNNNSLTLSHLYSPRPSPFPSLSLPLPTIPESWLSRQAGPPASAANIFRKMSDQAAFDASAKSWTRGSAPLATLYDRPPVLLGSSPRRAGSSRAGTPPPAMHSPASRMMSEDEVQEEEEAEVGSSPRRLLDTFLGRARSPAPATQQEESGPSA